jgi:flavin-dependent dehydrogenase
MLLEDDQLAFVGADEHAVQASILGQTLRANAVVLAEVPAPVRRGVLTLPQGWERGVLHRFTWLLTRRKVGDTPNGQPLLTMSLDLNGSLCWGWVIQMQGWTQLAVVQPVELLSDIPPTALLERWIDILTRHGVISSSKDLPPAAQAQQMDMALGGALTQEAVANRTVLIGPAGGFYSASAEDIYPNCWSAIHAVEVMRKALKERHLQDALQVFRQQWGSTLGDYLRGPQQNLRFLLPLVYRNPTMTARLAEAILLGKSVIR